MPKPLFKPPQKLIEEWPEIFEDMYMNTMPVDYIQYVRLEFNNGRIWEIDIQEQLVDATREIVTEKLLDAFTEYREDITKVDFSINIEKLKKDIVSETKNMF